LRAVASNAAGSGQVARGTRMSEGTLGTAVTTSKPKVGSFCVGADVSAPEWMASTMARVKASFMRLPVP